MNRIIHGEELLFDEKKHAYTYGGKYVPGVTSILKCLGKPQLINWAAGVASNHWLAALNSGRSDFSVIHKEAKEAHDKNKTAAGDVGKVVHRYAECVFKGLELPVLETDQAKRGVEAFHDWYGSHKIKILASERLVFSKQFFYAGTCDFVAEIDGELGVGDIKTGSGIYNDMRFQTAAYQHALEEEKRVKFPVRWIVRFDKKTGRFEVRSFRHFDLDFQGFASALTLHRTLQTIEEESNNG